MLAAIRSFQIILFALLLIGTFYGFVLADEYGASVTTDSGTYSVPVEIEDEAVTQVHWPNGGNMNVYGGDISEGEASGTNSRGDSVSVSLDDYPTNSDDAVEDNGSDSSDES
jgi:hypothetical protein